MASKAQKRAQQINWCIYCLKGMLVITRTYFARHVRTGELEVALTRIHRRLQEANHD